MKYLVFLFALIANSQTIPAPAETAAPATPDTASTAKSEERCRIEGKAVNALTGEPLQKVELTLTKSGEDNAEALLSYSESDGEFLLDDVAPGQFTLAASRTGFVDLVYGMKNRFDAGTLLTLVKGQALTGLVLRLQPQAVIAGKVTNEEGEPVPNVTLNVLSNVYQNGRKHLVPLTQSSTNDLGEYRAFGLAPGRYYVQAIPGRSHGGWLVSERVVGSAKVHAGANQSYPAIYYPNSLSPQGASLIDVQAGAQLQGIDIKLASTRMYSVSGRISPMTPALRGSAIMLLPRDEMFSKPPGFSPIDDKGAFHVRRISPGSYILSAEGSDNGKRVIARLPIDVTDSDIDGLPLSFTAMPSLKGRIVAENNADLKGANLWVGLGSKGGMPGGASANMKSDHTFTIDDVSPETYTVMIGGLPKGFYAKSVRFGDLDVTEEDLDLSHGVPAGELTILISAGAATVEGTVQNDSQQPAPGATVVLVPPADRRKYPDRYAVARTDQNGHFVMNGVRPGDYKLFTWEQVESGAYYDPDFLAPLEAKGQAVSLKENAHENLQLTSIPADK